jgi:hypothetical protein
MSRENVAALHEESHQKLIISKRGQLLEEFKLGVWSRQQYIRQVAALEQGVLDDEETPSKRRRTREYSPDWDIEDDLAGSPQFTDDT